MSSNLPTYGDRLVSSEQATLDFHQFLEDINDQSEENTDAIEVLDSRVDEFDSGWRDITSDIIARGTGPTDPNWLQIGSTPFWAYDFSLNDQVWMNFHVPHDYIKGTDIHIHTHWIPDGTDTSSVKWEFVYSYAHGHNQQEYDLTGTTITAEQVVGGTQYRHYVTETEGINILNMEPDGIIMVNITRVTNGGTDNTDGIFLLTADIHYQSNNRATLNRAPNFYG